MDDYESLVQHEIQLRKFGNLKGGKDNDRQKDVEEAWEYDRKAIDSITSSLSKTNDLTTKMMGTLNTFDDRVSKLLESIGSVQQKTYRWKTVHTNMSKTMSLIEESLARFEKIDSAKSIIKQSLSLKSIPEHLQKLKEKKKEKKSKPFNDTDSEMSQATGPPASAVPALAGANPPTEGISEDDDSDEEVLTLDDYLQTYDSIIELDKFFKEHESYKSAHNASLALGEISNTGRRHIFKFFDTLLLSNAKPLKLSTKGTVYSIKRGKENLLKGVKLEELLHDKRGIIHLLPEYFIRHLKKLVKRLQDTREGEAKSYLQVYIDRRSQFLVQTMRNAFNEATILASEIKDDTDQKSGVLDVLMRKQIEAKKRAEQALIAASLTYTKGSHLFLTYLRIQLLLIRSEYVLAETLLPSGVYLEAFSRIGSTVLAHFTEMSDALIRALRRNPNKIYSSSVMLDIFGVLQPLLSQYELIFSKCPPTEENGAITSFWVKLNTSAKQLFQQVHEDIKTDKVGLAADGTVHDLTSTSINFLKNLFGYKHGTLELLPPMPNHSKKSLLGDYIILVINDLKEALDEKARKDKRSSVLSNVFLLNNYYFILKNCGNSELAGELGPKALTTYQGWVDEQRELYRASWNKLMDFLIEDKYKDKDKSKAPAVIKSRFAGFNSELKDNHKAQSQLLISDPELRDGIRRELRQRMMPSYRAFIEKFKDVQFTKKPQNRAKYEKYDLAAAESMLNELFEGKGQ